MSLYVHQLCKQFEEDFSIEGISFAVSQGSVCALLGPSGCGKSTLLAMLAGLIVPDKGVIYWQGKIINEIPAHKRNFGLVFQDYVLFPHLSVAQNISFGLRMQGKDKPFIEGRMQELLSLVELNGYANRNVHTLSGGEQQRVALARAFATQPQLLMLDEPFSALDRGLRTYLLHKLRHILHNTHQTAIYVTHDQEEAFALADNVILMKHGKIIQQGTPHELYYHPNSTFTAQFLGLENIIPAHFEMLDHFIKATTAIGIWQTPPNVFNQPAEKEGFLLIRPDLVTLGNHNKHDLSAVMRESIFHGNTQEIIVETHNIILKFILPSGTPLPSLGEDIYLLFNQRSSLQCLPC